MSPPDRSIGGRIFLASPDAPSLGLVAASTILTSVSLSVASVEVSVTRSAYLLF
jgi:hypothetical protein